MRWVPAVALLFAAVWGCAPGPVWTDAGMAPPYQAAPPVVPQVQNPMLVPSGDPEAVWENLVDVIDDYFRIQCEQPVRVCNGVATEGRLDTFPEVGSTLLEPWRGDSANGYEKLESTLQTISRRAVIRVVPAEQGYWVDVAVFKYLEDAARPERATAGAATLRYDGGLTRIVEPIYEQPIEEGWIELGRDPALEQRILGQLMAGYAAPQPLPASAPYY